ncbi:hypothetical protein L2D14_07500 [Thalassospiraceae bacterium LMO-JJ14]|nr:hypothetical protein L2D14_07500 [Thalassospiraceae bacterium LMO-JJ14]
MLKKLTLIMLSPVFIFAAQTQLSAQHAHPSPYAGQQLREIKSLSAEDIAELQRGGGWGLARAAELNGMPGPAHLLELKDEIALSAEQIERITALYQDMHAKAVEEGEKFIAHERELDRRFRDATMNDADLRALLAEIAESRARLRFIHLSTHLMTPTILSRKQIDRYNTLRGYGASPCLSVPEGHDPVMWRRHNNCD